MHPYVVEQLAQDRWEELQRIGAAAAAASRSRRRRWWARETGRRHTGVAAVVTTPDGRVAAGRVVDLRDRTVDRDRDGAAAGCG